MEMTYGYVRVSTPKQHPERQHRNIKAAYPEAVMVEDIYTGTDLSRPNWNRLLARLNPGDTIVFDSVSRLSRDATEGYSIYADLFNRGINLVFLKEPHINTDTYRSALKNSIELTGTPVDLILDGINAYLLALANQQIRLAFEASEKEVADLRQRTREGIQTARIAGKQIGRKKGVSVETKKEREAKEIIKKHSTEFGGSLSDKEVIALAKISRNTYYKYKRELKGQLAGQILLFWYHELFDEALAEYNAKKTKTRDKMGNIKGVTLKEVKQLKALAVRGAEAEQTVQQQANTIELQKAQITSLERQLRPSIQKRLKEAQELSDLKNENMALEYELNRQKDLMARLMQRIEAALTFLEEKLPEQFRPYVQRARAHIMPEPKQEHRHDRGMSMGGMSR